MRRASITRARIPASIGAGTGGRIDLGPLTFIFGGLVPHFWISNFSNNVSNKISLGSIVKVNRLMKKMLQKLGNILSMLFVIWQDFVIFLQNTPCTVFHLSMACLPQWCCWTVLPDGVIQHNNFTCVHGRRKDFPGVALVHFSKSFSRGAKSGEICFLPLKTKKTALFAKICKFLPPYTHAGV